MPVPGQMLGDRYRLDNRIGAGGMGEIWQATDTVLGRDVAVKTLNTNREGDPEFQTRFRHEARAMAVLHHPNVADVFDYGESGTEAYIVMTCVEGEPLSRRIAQRGRLTAAETMSVVAQAARALDAAHRAGIVHRDVKPGNLIIKPDGSVVLVDFGVARTAGSPTLTGAKEIVGTALYIAPEQVSKQLTGPPADIYALGAVAYHCLAGHPPFLGDNPLTVALRHVQDDPPELPPDVPDAVRALVTTAMAKDAAQRFPSAEAMADAAEAAAGTVNGTTADGTRTAVAGMLAADDTGIPRVSQAPAYGNMAVRPVPADSGTAILPPAGSPTKRRRGSALAVVLGLLTLAAIAAVLVFADPAGLLPGGTNRSTTAPASAGTGGGSAPPGADATDHDGSVTDDRGTTTHPTASSIETARPSQSGAVPATATTSVTRTRSPTTSPRPTQSVAARATATTSATPTHSPTTSPRSSPTTTHSAAPPSAPPAHSGTPTTQRAGLETTSTTSAAARTTAP